ncbi:hypothetical protein [Bacillus thuringiensis]|uniref:hypothetical protein n=1 Tax=Bacillus thuringiensis TaxID=1428 RepID=UPI000CD8EE68|nr:hypothetical protein [Bacillus thuringiensis]
MRLGYNYPYSHLMDGSDIGPYIHVDPAEWKKRNDLEATGNISSIPLPPLFDHIDRNLRNLKNMGFSVIRWFILGNGTNYGPSPKRVIRYKMSYWKNPMPIVEYNFDPPPIIDKRFRRDFEELLRRFKAAKLQLIPSLIDFAFGSELLVPSGCCGRADVIRIPAKRKIFLDTMLAELLEASKPFKEQIFAWEVINEPIWLCTPFGPLSKPEWNPRRTEVSSDEMTEFLNDAIQRIEKAGFQSTVGHRFYSDLTKFPTGSIPQFHTYYSSIFGYSDPVPMQGKRLWRANPKPILGEFDSDQNRYGEVWASDLGTKDSTLERLKLLEREGCDLALIWPELGDAKKGRISEDVKQKEQDVLTKKDIIKLLDKTRQAIVNYTGGILPPKDE